MKVKLLLFLLWMSITASAENEFHKTIYNKELDVFFTMNLYADNVSIPGQGILGTCYGYLRKTTDSRVWIVTDVNITADGHKAHLEMINDYGSEDLEAEITLMSDGNYELRQLSGSTIKVANKGKWQKLPKVIIFSPKK